MSGKVKFSRKNSGKVEVQDMVIDLPAYNLQIQPLCRKTETVEPKATNVFSSKDCQFYQPKK